MRRSPPPPSPSDGGRRRRQHDREGGGGGKRRTTTTGAATTATGGGRKSKLPVLLRLSEACEKHRASHRDDDDGGNHGRGGDGASGASRGTASASASSAAAGRCVKELETFRHILPRVEKSLRPPAPALTAGEPDDRGGGAGGGGRGDRGGNKVGDEALSNARYLCALYRSVLCGGFCPHSMMMLDEGRGGVEVFPRIHQLLQHIVHPANHAATTLAKSTDATADATTTATTTTAEEVEELRRTTAEVAATIGKFVSAIPQDAVRLALLRDVVTACWDLSTVREAWIATTTDAMDMDSTEGGDGVVPPVRLSLFDRAVAESRSLGYYRDGGGDGDGDGGKGGVRVPPQDTTGEDNAAVTVTPEFLIDLCSLGALEDLRSALHLILLEVLSTECPVVLGRVLPRDSCRAVEEEEEELLPLLVRYIHSALVPSGVARGVGIGGGCEASAARILYWLACRDFLAESSGRCAGAVLRAVGAAMGGHLRRGADLRPPSPPTTTATTTTIMPPDDDGEEELADAYCDYLVPSAFHVLSSMDGGGGDDDGGAVQTRMDLLYSLLDCIPAVARVACGGGGGGGGGGAGGCAPHDRRLIRMWFRLVHRVLRSVLRCPPRPSPGDGGGDDAVRRRNNGVVAVVEARRVRIAVHVEGRGYYPILLGLLTGGGGGGGASDLGARARPDPRAPSSSSSTPTSTSTQWCGSYVLHMILRPLFRCTSGLAKDGESSLGAVVEGICRGAAIAIRRFEEDRSGPPEDGDGDGEVGMDVPVSGEKFGENNERPPHRHASTPVADQRPTSAQSRRHSSGKLKRKRRRVTATPTQHHPLQLEYASNSPKSSRERKSPTEPVESTSDVGRHAVEAFEDSSNDDKRRRITANITGETKSAWSSRRGFRHGYAISSLMIPSARRGSPRFSNDGADAEEDIAEDLIAIPDPSLKSTLARCVRSAIELAHGIYESNLANGPEGVWDFLTGGCTSGKSPASDIDTAASAPDVICEIGSVARLLMLLVEDETGLSSGNPEGIAKGQIAPIDVVEDNTRQSVLLRDNNSEMVDTLFAIRYLLSSLETCSMTLLAVSFASASATAMASPSASVNEDAKRGDKPSVRWTDDRPRPKLRILKRILSALVDVGFSVYFTGLTTPRPPFLPEPSRTNFFPADGDLLDKSCSKTDQNVLSSRCSVRDQCRSSLRYISHAVLSVWCDGSVLGTSNCTGSKANNGPCASGPKRSVSSLADPTRNLAGDDDDPFLSLEETSKQVARAFAGQHENATGSDHGLDSSGQVQSRFCVGLCTAICASFGIKGENGSSIVMDDCFCGMVDDHMDTCGSLTGNSCDSRENAVGVLLVEECLTLPARCVLLACLVPVNGKSVTNETTMDAPMDDVKRSECAGPLPVRDTLSQMLTLLGSDESTDGANTIDAIIHSKPPSANLTITCCLLGGLPLLVRSHKQELLWGGMGTADDKEKHMHSTTARELLSNRIQAQLVGFATRHPSSVCRLCAQLCLSSLLDMSGCDYLSSTTEEHAMDDRQENCSLGPTRHFCYNSVVSLIQHFYDHAGWSVGNHGIPTPSLGHTVMVDRTSARCRSQSKARIDPSTRLAPDDKLLCPLPSLLLYSKSFDHSDPPREPSSYVRLARWKFLARSCMVLNNCTRRSPSTLWDVILRSTVFSNDSIENNDEKIGESSGETGCVAGPDQLNSDRDDDKTDVQPNRLASSSCGWLSWMLRAPFLDSDPVVRSFAAQNFGKVLLAGSEFSLLYAAFSPLSIGSKDQEAEATSKIEWENLPPATMTLATAGGSHCGRASFSTMSFKIRETEESIIVQFFHFLERCMYQNCYFPQSQLSFSVTQRQPLGSGCRSNLPLDSSSPSDVRRSPQFGAVMSAASSSNSTSYAQPTASSISKLQSSALRALSSLCEEADVATLVGKAVYENSLLKLIRFWYSNSSQPAPTCDDGYADEHSAHRLSYLAYSELCRLNSTRSIRSVLRTGSTLLKSFAPLLFSEILLSPILIGGIEQAGNGGGVNASLAPKTYRYLVEFIRKFLLSSSPGADDNGRAELEYVESVLPIIVPTFVIEEDYSSLQMCAKMRLFLQNRQKSRTGGVNAPSTKAEDATKNMCVEPDMIEHVVCRALLHHDSKAPFIFLLKTVCNSQVTLGQLFMARGQLILKRLVWELGGSYMNQHDRASEEGTATGDMNDHHYFRSEYEKDDVLQALKKGAVICQHQQQQQQHSTGSTSKKDRNALDGVDAMENDAAKPAKCEDALEEWINTNFMYLLVNVVAYRWNTRHMTDKMRAMNCLRGMLKFLRPADSPQYLPRIMSIVNTAMSMDSEGTNGSDAMSTSLLRLLAVECLSAFVHVVLVHQVKTVGFNVAEIVVSLLPVLDYDIPDIDDQQEPPSDYPSDAYAETAAREAVQLLESLVSGRVGRQLAPFFHHVPFLPSTPNLIDVRRMLKENGVDFDSNVLTAASSSTQNKNCAVGDDDASAGSNMATDDGSDESAQKLQAALYRRLRVLCDLITHESVAVRRVVIRHASSLLRSNRRLFHSLVESEEVASMRFLTVVNDEHVVAAANDDGGSKAEDEVSSLTAEMKETSQIVSNGGAVSTLVQRLLSRSMIETDQETRIACATLLGEIGAIDPNRVSGETMKETTTSTSALGGGSSTGDHCNDAWRLAQPPWKSQVMRYELRLVTKYLVVALKSAPTSQDQDKIAFAIQELLVLLNEFGKVHGDGSLSTNIDADAHDDKQDSKTGAYVADSNDNSTSQRMVHITAGSNKGTMSTWLVQKLISADVLEIVEPFWSTSYMQRDVASSRKPPFFKKATSYFQWLSSWCRFMVERSKENDRSRWKDLFHACRAAIRSPAALSVGEFLLPLLVLDMLCFGSESDETVVVNELHDVLSNTGDCASGDQPESSESNAFINGSERQRAVNAVFTVLDTLQIWAERETEDRHRTMRRGDAKGCYISKSSKHQSSAICLAWPADESVIRINDLVQKLPTRLCSKAAADVGMHARALRYLEVDARSKIASQVFDDTYDVDSGVGDNSKSKDGRLGGGTAGALAPFRELDLGLAQQLLGRLNDCDAMTALSQECTRIGLSQNLIDQIREREVYGDWSAALQGYEQVLQIRGCSLESSFEANPEDAIFPGGACDQSEHLNLEHGMLKALLELGHLESVVNQVHGMLHRAKQNDAEGDWSVVSNVTRCSSNETHRRALARLLPSAAEAAWRLGRWTLLDDLVSEHEVQIEGAESGLLDSEAQYQIAIGQAMLGISRRSHDAVSFALKDAKLAAMTALSRAARESYSRSYPSLLRLHCVKEIEDASTFFFRDKDTDAREWPDKLGEIAYSSNALGWDWDGRLKMTASDVVSSSAVVNVRLALSRLASDPGLEGGLWLTTGKHARKQGLLHVAETSLAHAEAAFTALTPETGDGKVDTSASIFCSRRNEVQMQVAKLRYASGEASIALRLVEGNDLNVRTLLQSGDGELGKAVSNILSEKGSVATTGDNAFTAGKLQIFGRKLLQATEWMAEGGLKGGAEVIDRYRLVLRVSPQWEKAHFSFARYLDSLLTARISALSGIRRKSRGTSDDEEIRIRILRSDAGCHHYLLQAMEQYGNALTMGEKHVYQALPRLLTIYFEFTSITEEEINVSSGGVDEDKRKRLLESQRRANSIMSNLVKAIPPHSFYTALPQLVSRVGHRDRHTVDNVKAILRRVLAKFPAQAMWGLACLRHSKNSERASIGDEIFKGAQRQLQRSENMRMHDLLVACKSLFKFLIDLSRYQPKNPTHRHFSVRPWKGEVPLVEFVPPVQAALSITSSVRSGSSGRTGEVFPAFVPRMRTLCSRVQVMSSKARPKKITAFAVPAGQKYQQANFSSRKEHTHLQPGDAGEMHFLVKQEAKGDLRKDARVQDLNNVINRLLAAGQGRRQGRRLRLRTFSVVCLSEDCGILEWVPNTDSFRNIISRSYNPQAAPHSIRRRGERTSNFSDLTLRNAFQQCQDVYVKSGDLLTATSMFEEMCLKAYPPLMYWWFTQQFLDPHAWFEARTAFTLSAAVWSAVGHVIGLGDRHSENILIDTSCGECVHVDFDCIFDKGLHLPRPEVVPFRLTPNMVDAMGPTGWRGTYLGGLTAAMQTLRTNKDTLLSVLEPFVKDPVIDWKRHRTQQKQGGGSGGETEKSNEAKRSIKVIEGRLRGVYNLRNPNVKKIKRTDGYSMDQEDEMAHILPLSVDGQVQRMINEATSHENLVQLYVGWMPWL